MVKDFSACDSAAESATSLAHEPLGQLMAGAPHDASGVHLGGGEVAAVDVETDDPAT